MKRYKEISRRITQLEKDLDLIGSQAVDDFINELRTHGAPIIEEIIGDDEHSLVTFIYHGNESDDSILVLPPVDMRNFEENKMINV